MTDEIIKNLGPLAPLAGTWEGDKGDDTAPSKERGTGTNKFRERITFEPMGPVNNHEQQLYGLRYATTAWPLGCERSLSRGVGLLAVGRESKASNALFYGAARGNRYCRRHGGAGREIIRTCRRRGIGNLRHQLQPIPRQGIQNCAL